MVRPTRRSDRSQRAEVQLPATCRELARQIAGRPPGVDRGDQGERLWHGSAQVRARSRTGADLLVLRDIEEGAALRAAGVCLAEISCFGR